MKTKNYKNSIEFVLTNCYEINEICRPLKRIGIVYFSYTKVFNDGSRVEVTNHPEFTKYYYLDTNLFETHPYESDPQQIEPGYIPWSIYENDESVIALREIFGIANGISILEKSTDYCELWHFAADRSNWAIQDFYLNNLDVLKLFCFYFKDKAAHIIKQNESNKIKLFTLHDNELKQIQNSSQLNMDMTLNSDIRLQLIESLSDCKRYHLGERYHNNYLTKREMDCLSWCIKGKSASEVALILDISEETVRSYLKSIKYKLSCFKQASIIKEVMSLGILINY